MTLCPYCEGQGVIHTATIKSTDEVIYICSECDTMWLTKDIEDQNGQPFEFYMKDKGLKGYWSELKDIKIIE